MNNGFSDSQALSTFLTVESFLLAVVGLSVTLGAPGQKVARKLPLPAIVLASIAVAIQALAACGAALAWWGLFAGGGDWLPGRQIAIAAIILLVLAAQPVLSCLLTLGMRAED